MREDWGDGHVTPRDILDAAKDSSAGHPGVISRDHTRIEVTADGAVLDISIKDEWGKTVRVRIPRSLVDSLSKEKRVSGRDVLRRLDDRHPALAAHLRSTVSTASPVANARSASGASSASGHCRVKKVSAAFATSRPPISHW